jgi:hypothetical protein
VAVVASSCRFSLPAHQQVHCRFSTASVLYVCTYVCTTCACSAHSEMLLWQADRRIAGFFACSSHQPAVYQAEDVCKIINNIISHCCCCCTGLLRCLLCWVTAATCSPQCPRRGRWRM